MPIFVIPQNIGATESYSKLIIIIGIIIISPKLAVSNLCRFIVNFIYLIA